MSRFRGITTHPLDGKGRVSLPAKFRKMLPDDLVIVRSPQENFPALRIYSEEGYEAWEDALWESKGGFRANSESHAYLDTEISGNVEDITVDQAGRILISKDLRNYASLDKSVLVIGVRDHIEIWNADIRAKCQEEYASSAKILDMP